MLFIYLFYFFEKLANTLLFVLHSITSDEKAIEQIRREFDTYRDCIIPQEALAHASYTKACIQESFRVQPTAFGLARILEEDMIMSDEYLLRAGVSCSVNGISINGITFFFIYRLK